MASSELERRAREGLTDIESEPIATTTEFPHRATLWAGVGPYRAIMYPIDGGELEIPIPGNSPPWVLPTVQRLGELLSLPPNWDSYGSPRIDTAYVEEVLKLAFDVMLDDTPAPSVVPTSRGGVQLEWHTRGIDLEVEFLTPWRVAGLCEDRETGASWEADLSFDLKRLTNTIALLSRRS